MNRVFFGGSRRIARLNKDIRAHVEDILKKGHTVLIGDANGADKAFQQFIADKKCRNVIVFCTGTECRNNLGNWEVRFVQSERTSKDFVFYAAKDLQMIKEADYGFVLWDGKSRGTLNNILNMLESAKKVLVYFSPKRLFINLFSTRDLSHLIRNCDSKSLANFEKALRINKRLNADQGQLNLV